MERKKGMNNWMNKWMKEESKEEIEGEVNIKWNTWLVLR